jgi:hypothetical protein
VENGPDLRVRLTPAGRDAPNDELNHDFADLGALKGNIGNQSYVLPAALRPDRYHAVVIWVPPLHVRLRCRAAVHLRPQ